MRIETDIKLDFSDVLIRPKRSVLQSRVEVSLEREFHVRHSGTTWSGIPLVAANMDHTGTFAMAQTLSQHRLLTGMDKFITLDDWKKFAAQHAAVIPHCFISL